MAEKEKVGFRLDVPDPDGSDGGSEQGSDDECDELVPRDPAECGSYLGALVCDGGIVRNCGGKLLHSNPLQTEAPWKCQSCGKVI